MNTLVETHQGYECYEIQYPDGSKVTMKANPGSKKNTTNQTNLVTPKGTYSEDTFGVYWKTDDNYSGASVDVQYTNGSTAVWDLSVFNMNYSFGNYTATIQGFETGQTGYGTVMVSNAAWLEPYGSSCTSDENHSGNMVEAENQVVFSTSGSISGNFGPLGVSVNGGATWTCYAMARLSPYWDEFDAVAAQNV